jgi:hypothetical protein
MASPGFKLREVSNPLNLTNLEEEKGKQQENQKFRPIISPMLKRESSGDDINMNFMMNGRKISRNEENGNGKNDDNRSFTFENGNPATGSMMSVLNQMTSPNANFNQKSRPELRKDPSLMQMLNDIGSIQDPTDSFAATKAAMKGEATDLVQEDTEKKKKRKQKLKMKGKGLKVDIPTKNKFIPENQGGARNNQQSPIRKLHTPTPTKMLMNTNKSNTGADGMMFYNQLSKNGNGIPKINMESPFMLFQESRGNNQFSNLIDPRFGTPNRFMSPGSQATNPDHLKYMMQFSNGMYVPDNRDSAFVYNSRANNPPLLKDDGKADSPDGQNEDEDKQL